MQLHSQSLGAGPPLLILHGLFGSLDNWNTVSRKLSENFHVIAADLRNHGLSPHSSEMSFESMAEDVAELMVTHKLPTAFVLGHSLGGKVAMELALRHQDKVEKLIVVDIAPRASASRHREILDAMLSLDLSAFDSRKPIEEALAPAVPELAVRQFLLKNLTRDPNGRFHWKINLPAIDRNYPHLNEAIRVGRKFNKPTLFIRGALSDYLGEEDFPLIEELFPQAEIETLPGAGHWVHAEVPDIFVRTVSNFLKSN
jgi:esterase